MFARTPTVAPAARGRVPRGHPGAVRGRLTDCSARVCAAAAPAGSSGSSACCESVLSGAKEEIETVRAELLRVQRSLTSPSLAELCQRFHAIAASNQRMLDQIECQFEADPAMKYKAFTRGEATTAVPCLAAASPAADDSPADAAVGVPLVVQEPCQGRAGAQERSSIGSTGSFNSLAGRYENCSSPSPLSLPSHLQVSSLVCTHNARRLPSTMLGRRRPPCHCFRDRYHALGKGSLSVRRNKSCQHAAAS